MHKYFILIGACGALFTLSYGTHLLTADLPTIHIDTSVIKGVSLREEGESKEESALPPSHNPIRVPILIYHGVRDTTPDEPADVRQFNIAPHALAQQLAYLAENGYTTIHMHDLAEHLTKGVPLPEKPVILTFDDGWRSQYLHGFPLLQEYGMTATFYLFPNAMEHTNFMSWDEVRELVDAGMEIGSHSRSHQYMHRQDPQEYVREIAGSKAWLEEELDTPVRTFAYPFGIYTDEIISLTETLGYTSARALHHTTLHTADSRYTLGGYLVGNNHENVLYILTHAE
jgi:peptidoglycan/xylan/chitin deacetylase (PgdA/CDA1 family)